MIRLIVLVLATAVWAGSASRAEAQGVSFDRLGLRVDEGDRVSVTDLAGRELDGRILDFSASSLSLEADGIRHDLSEGDIAVVRHRERDSLRNGTAVGFAVGVGFAAYVFAQCDDAPPAAWVFGTLLYGTVGAGIGAGVDAMHERSREVYRAQSFDRRLVVAPVLSRGGGGVSLSLGF